jgi:hypothetical protein
MSVSYAVLQLLGIFLRQDFKACLGQRNLCCDTSCNKPLPIRKSFYVNKRVCWLFLNHVIMYFNAAVIEVFINEFSYSD